MGSNPTPSARNTSRPSADGGNLYLSVSKRDDGNIRRSWVFRYQAADGRDRRMGLGPAHTVTLAMARQLATEARQARLTGKDPLDQRKTEKAAQRLARAKDRTFDECAAEYIAAHQHEWRNAIHRRQWAQTLRDYVAPVFGKLPVQAVDRGLVIQALKPLWHAKPETAGRLRGRIETVIDYAEAHGYRPEGTNPARLGPIETILGSRSRKVDHHAALPYTEIGGFLAELKAKEAIAARALEFAIATATRTNEVIGAVWSEIDLDARTWTIPADRMKAERDHRVPLNKTATGILEAMAKFRESDFVFPGPTRAKLSNMAMLMLLRRMGGELTVHGFRATFKTWASERTSFPREIVEASLAHAIGNAVEQAYQRGDLFDKRRRLMDAWSEFCAAPGSAKVLLMRKS